MPLLFLMEDRNFSKHAQLLSKALHSLALCLDCCQNHLQIAHFSQQAFTLFTLLKDYIHLIATWSDDTFTSQAQQAEQEARSRWSAITMNLAFVLSKLHKLKSD